MERRPKRVEKNDTTNVVSVIDRAKELSMAVFGYPLIANTNQNSTYLSSKLEPNVIRPDGDDGGYALKMTNTTLCDDAADAQVAYTPQHPPFRRFYRCLHRPLRHIKQLTIALSTQT